MKPLLITVCALALAGPALAGQAVSLKFDTTDADGRVTLGDLFDGAGSASSVLVATRMGPTTVLDAGQVQLAARRAGLDWTNTQGVRRIIVRQGVDGGGNGAGAVRARGNVEVLAYARSLSAGEIVQPQDLIWVKMAASPSDAPQDADALIGMSAKRPLREGAAASLRDVSAAQVIKNGDIITVIYENEGISLALQGKAMTAAAAGDVVSVQNTLSKKIIQAVATGPGSAMVGPQAQSLQTRSPIRFAAR
ncbi:MAG: flagella basal body P-ring formation protein FlgA [Caulobacter sp. 12-67-6]|nr:MAG: flagella basal body P-ring formation protein FlgA [Caulobacter sp. 12-67-6]OYX72474.1 MAG: flagella basal body P-ring formation protein FlgA [Caulobacter sp. 32-67-35]OYX90944.1 MAG: flagella basal body P-ring formation protein FlgA [Caulobacter sp. 35-67-4]